MEDREWWRQKRSLRTLFKRSWFGLTLFPFTPNIPSHYQVLFITPDDLGFCVAVGSKYSDTFLQECQCVEELLSRIISSGKYHIDWRVSTFFPTSTFCAKMQHGLKGTINKRLFSANAHGSVNFQCSLHSLQHDWWANTFRHNSLSAFRISF